MTHRKGRLPGAVAAIGMLMLSACGGGSVSGHGTDAGAAGPEFDRNDPAGIFRAAGFLDHTPAYAAGEAGIVEAPVSLDIAGLEAEIPETWEPVSDEAFNGVPVGRTPTDGTGEDASPRKLGGWLDGSYFEARATRDPGRTDPGAFDTVLAYSLGDAAGRNPVDGGATWKGAAVGFDARPGSVHPVLGSATLTVDLAPWSSFPHIAAVDIVLGDLRRVSDPQFIYDDIRFDRVPLLDGEFADEPVTPAVVGEFPMRHRVRGAFYGSDHAEAGGTFVTAPTGDHREQAIVGAFGARRGE